MKTFEMYCEEIAPLSQNADNALQRVLNAVQTTVNLIYGQLPEDQKQAFMQGLPAVFSRVKSAGQLNRDAKANASTVNMVGALSRDNAFRGLTGYSNKAAGMGVRS